MAARCQPSTGNRPLSTRIRLIAFGLSLLLGVAAPEGGAQERPIGRVSGRVISATTEHPVVGAALTLPGTSLASVSDSAGRFVFPRVPVGIYELRVRAIGFTPTTSANLVVGSGKPVFLTVTLRPIAIELDPLDVRPTPFAESPAVGIGSRSLQTEEIRRAPGVQEDVVRSVSLLPGVGVTTGGRNDLVVRGGAPYENLFVVDGIEVPNINHFGSQGSTGGPLSLLNVDLVERADFSAGGFGVRYGDRTASLTAITLRDGEPDRAAGELNLSATGFGAMIEGPLGSGTTYLLSARRSYLDLLFKAAGFSFIPAYWDVQFKSTTRIDRSNTLSMLGIGAINTVQFTNDDADDRYDNSRIMAPEQNQYVVGARWKHLLHDGLLTVTAGRTLTAFRTRQQDSLNPPTVVFRNSSTEGENSLRIELAMPLNRRVDVVVGTVSRWASRLDYDVALDGEFRTDTAGNPRPLTSDTSFTAFRTAGYAQAAFRPTMSLDIEAGLRFDYYAFLTDRMRVAPRLALRARIDDATSVTARAGRYYQAPPYIWLIGDPTNPATLQPIESDQMVVGLERLVRDDTRIQVELYHKWYRHYPARVFRPQAVLAPTGFEDVTGDIPFGLEPLSSEGSGRTYGVEFLLQKRLSAIPVYGLASVSVGRAEFAGLDGVDRAGRFDARFLGNVMVGWRPGRDWELSGKLRVATGLPTTPFLAAGPEVGRLNFTRYNAGPRLPTYHALDVRIDRRWSFRALQLITYVDVQNVYGRANVSAYRWDDRTQMVEPDESLGVLPSIGINVEF